MSAGPGVTALRLVLTVDDFDAAVRFYRDVLGLEQVAAWPSEGGRIVLLGAGRATLELVDEGQAAAIDAIEVGRRVAGPVRIALEVPDSAHAASRLVEAGAELLAEPVVTPWRDRNVRVRAPDGMQLTLFTPLGDEGA
jgi:catechol 2,3-dioxygenase-like lactoylglutathione lyase family enzyme